MCEHPARTTPEDWADLLKTSWEERARSDSRDFYVASHPGWDDAERWRQQADVDAELLFHELSGDWLSTAHVLEIGCGVGRLAPSFLARTASYTGIDIAKPMVDEAKRRVPDARARFFVSQGLGVSAEAKDRRYDLIVAWAVFIHCPRDVVGRLARDAVSLLVPGGHLRFQLLADPTDATGLTAPPADVVASTAEFVAQGEAATREDMELIDDHYYMGHAFRYDDAQDLLGSMGGDLRLLRFDLGHIYGDLVMS
jgi:2-polyprenyl-3-methyl-5-hydroxy-6-metoxy-1,4-benzoquinol methylase